MPIRRPSDYSKRGKVDWARVDSTTEEELRQQEIEDRAEIGFVPGLSYTVWEFKVPDVQALRVRLGLTQRDFALRYALSFRTVQQWEQGRAVPDQPAKVLLKAIEFDPECVARAAQQEIDAIRKRVRTTLRKMKRPAKSPASAGRR
jgi:putative transcriptional regulator